jgi:hypothetical protein
VNTIYHLFDLFSNDSQNKSERYEDFLNDSAFTLETLKDDGVLISKIPHYLKNIKFKDCENITRFEQEFLKFEAKQWLENCLNDLKSKLATSFKYSNNLKSLVLIRDSVIEFESSLMENKNSNTTSVSNNSDLDWHSICEYLFEKKIELWSEYVSPFYYAQSKVSTKNENS